VLYSLAVGIAFSAVTLLLYLTFARVSVSVTSPTIRVTGILLTSLLGILLLHEPFTWRYLIGLSFNVAGVAFIVFR
jgi:multidrug transporter EmrE-like cation transporter